MQVLEAVHDPVAARGAGGTSASGGHGSTSKALAHEVTWRELGWEELVAEADRLGPDGRFAALSDVEVVEQLSVGAAQLDAALCRWLELLAELVVRRVWADQGARTPAVWLSWKLGIAPSTAREHVRVALSLREFPATRERFAAGTMSYSKVRAITRRGGPSYEDKLLEWADDATAQQLERVAAGFRTAERARHDAELDGQDPADRCIVRSRTCAGGRRELVISGPAERIVAIEDALRRLADDLATARTFPGCGVRRHLHAHHVIHWADGGPTDLANLVLLCGHHHRFIHAHGWRIEVRRDGRHRYRTATSHHPVDRVGRRPAVTADAVATAAPSTASAEALLPPAHLGSPYDLDPARPASPDRRQQHRSTPITDAGCP